MRVSGIPSLVLLLLFAILPHLHAQQDAHVTIGNSFVSAKVITDNSSMAGAGRFVIGSGPFHGNYNYLFDITSFIVFRVRMNNATMVYYTNAKEYVGGQPMIDATTPVAYKPFDSVYTSSDTVVVIWEGVGGYVVTMRLTPEKPTTSYDRGTDMLIEFEYTPIPFAPVGELGIFMMLDTYNGQALNSSGGSGDRSSVLTNRGYFPVDGPGKTFQSPRDVIPDFYHVGNFLYQTPLNTLMPVHRLRGNSRGGSPLTQPDFFAIGNWRRFRFLSWDVSAADVTDMSIGDCATICRWERLTGTGKLRTAFGTSDKEGNNLFHCRDQKLFVDIKTARFVEQKEKNGVFTPSSFDVEMWVTNTTDNFVTAEISFQQPIGSPNYIGRLVLDPSTPAVKNIVLPRYGTEKLTWRVNVNPGTNDSLIEIPLDFRFLTADLTGPPRIFKLPCTPKVAIKGYREVIPPPPPRDTLPPPITRVQVTRTPWPVWTFRTYDRHPNYIHDTGLNRIVVESNDGANFTLNYTSPSFVRCDTTVSVNITARVVDSTRSGRIIFAVYDCEGNVSRDSAIYNPRPDTFKPKVDTIYYSGSADGSPCNSRVFSYHLSDYINQTPQAGDNGFGGMQVLGQLVNFDPVEVNYDRGGMPIRDFDRWLSFRLRVIDTMLDARATILVSDYAGNADTIDVNYCTLPDVLAPIASATPTGRNNEGDTSWTIRASDSLAWDRGLQEVAVLTNINMVYNDVKIVPGERDVMFDVAVDDKNLDASITLEIRDRIYATTPAGHADTVRLYFGKIPDTVAPNIIYRPVAGSNGSRIDVEVNDIHYYGSELYLFDRGLRTINILSMSTNMRLVSPISFNTGDMTTTFTFEVIDTLAFHKRDTFCLEAIDIFGNRSEACYYYPLLPDTNSPIFLGMLDPTRSRISAEATDNRLYDRGLGSVELEDAENIVLDGNNTGLNGAASHSISATVTEPTLPFSGTFVIRDMVAERERTAETEEIHAVRLPFSMPAVYLKVDLPETVEGNQDIVAAIVAGRAFPGSQVKHLEFRSAYGGGTYKAAYNARAAVNVIEMNAGELDISIRPDPLRDYSEGDTLGYMVFGTTMQNSVVLFSFDNDESSLRVNDGAGTSITVQKPNDLAISVLNLPPPLFRMVADSTTYVNGECERILMGSRNGRAKMTGLAILGIRPQPIVSSGGQISIDVRSLPANGAICELISANGEKVASFELRGSGAELMRITFPLPPGIAAGAYILRLRAGTEDAWTKVIVVE